MENQSKLISDGIKALGILWNPHQDELRYSVKIDTKQRINKREILSVVARIFDPLGLIGPIVIVGKIILQDIWKQHLAWDETVPHDIHKKWTDYCQSVQNISSIHIPRKVIHPKARHLEIHGFSDASEDAFGACIYIRSSDEIGNHHSNILCAKSKVAPIKRQSIPRLELCGALLLARLIHKTLTSLTIVTNKIYLWTDSSIALHWITTSPHLWKTYVSNRTSEIQELVPNATWKHVPGPDNPADIISRGMNCNSLISSRLWWHGPSFLKEDEGAWPAFNENQLVTLEQKSEKTLLVSEPMTFSIFDQYSTLIRLQRVTAWCLRFIHNSKLQPEKRNKGELTVHEVQRSLKCLIKISQFEEFQDDVQQLKRMNSVSASSNIVSLHPFIDKEGLIRVGGRLVNADLPYEQKHQLLLPPKHRLTKLIFDFQRRKMLHIGPQGLLAVIRLKYWPISGNNMAKLTTRTCYKCVRAKPRSLEQIMGNLPSTRVKPSRRFTYSGVDYAGPFYIKDGKLKNRRIVKVYMCLFVCFSTKAIHLELSSDLTTKGFSLCLRRFISRRGNPKRIYSDNGTNFVGARNELRYLSHLLPDKDHNQRVQQFVVQNEIEWHFIPPRGPHFGGIWEGGVKSAKTHLVRVLGRTHLTYEQLYTVMVEVEACLNSRPITGLSSNPEDELPLTPGHFLIGTALTALPQRDVRDIRENRLNKFQRTQQLLQHFWSRWQSEYLQALQQ